MKNSDFYSRCFNGSNNSDVIIDLVVSFSQCDTNAHFGSIVEIVTIFPYVSILSDVTVDYSVSNLRYATIFDSVSIAVCVTIS